jgi:hypothetical protein
VKITTKAVFDIASGELLEWEGYEYDGPVALCGGGPSDSQKAAAASQAAENQQNTATQQQMLQMYKDQYAKINPFETSIMANGLPYLKALTDYSNGTTARSFLPGRAQLIRNLGGVNPASQPNGFKTAAIADYDNNTARAFDDNMSSALTSDYNARQQAASALTNQQQLANPLSWANAVTAGNSSIMQAPLSTPSPFAPILGAVSGLGSSAITKF